MSSHWPHQNIDHLVPVAILWAQDMFQLPPAKGRQKAALFCVCVQGPAVLIGKTKDGVVFGGYNGVGWASVEDYRDTFSAFLFVYDEGEVEILEKVGPPAIFDFGAQGPTFGADSLKIPLGKAPSMGSSYAAAGGGFEALGGEGSQEATSRLGCYYAGRSDGSGSLFGEAVKVELAELRIYVEQ